MKVLDAKFVKGFIRMADDGWNQGWHERNGGNLTYRIRNEEIEEIRENFSYDRDWTPIGTSVPGLAGEFFMTTGSGKYFRNIILDAESNTGIVEIDSKGENFRIVWGLTGGARPTSELPSHLMNHEVKKEISSLVATAISLPPGTIHGTTPIPSGNTTGHSVAISQISLVKTSSESSRTKVRAIVLAG